MVGNKKFICLFFRFIRLLMIIKTLSKNMVNKSNCKMYNSKLKNELTVKVESSD